MKSKLVHRNSVHQLRAEQLKLSTREFKARGAALTRCDACLLAVDKCICDSVTPIKADIAVCMLMYHAEYFKPSNTGQLICELVNDNHAFRWHRTEYQNELKSLLENEAYYPIIIFPHDNVEDERKIHQLPEATAINGKKPLLIFLDGTWRQAKKMFVKSPYLQSLPVLAIDDIKRGSYQLRESYHEHHLSTVEVAYELLKQNGYQELSDSLKQLFLTFKSGYQAYKR